MVEFEACNGLAEGIGRIRLGFTFVEGKVTGVETGAFEALIEKKGEEDFGVITMKLSSFREQ